MTIRKITVYFFAIVLLVSGSTCRAQQSGDSSQCRTTYENHNQIDYGPLRVRAVKGTSIIQVGSENQPGVAGACFVLFTEKENKFVVSTKANSDGRFELKDVVPGRYRLIARAEGLCIANIPIEVVKHSGRRKKEIILVHFRPVGIDTCSYGELTPQSDRR